MTVELARRCLQDGWTVERIRRELWEMTTASTLDPIDPDLAVTASEAARELRERARSVPGRVPGLADGLVLATARRTGSQVLTGDPHFRGLRETLWLP